MKELKENIIFDTVGVLLGLIPWVILSIKYDC